MKGAALSTLYFAKYIVLMPNTVKVEEFQEKYLIQVKEKNKKYFKRNNNSKGRYHC